MCPWPNFWSIRACCSQDVLFVATFRSCETKLLCSISSVQHCTMYASVSSARQLIWPSRSCLYKNTPICAVFLFGKFVSYRDNMDHSILWCCWLCDKKDCGSIALTFPKSFFLVAGLTWSNVVNELLKQKPSVRCTVTKIKSCCIHSFVHIFISEIVVNILG